MEVIWNRTCLNKQAKQGCVNKDRIFIFGYTVALTLSVYSQKAPGTASHNNGVFVCVFVSGIARRFRTAVCEGDLQGGRGHLLAGTGWQRPTCPDG